MSMENVSVLFGMPHQVKDETAITVTHNEFQRDVRSTQSDLESRANGLRKDATQQVKQFI